MIFDISSLTGKDTTTVRWIILHQFTEDGPWYPSWCSELVTAGTESEKEQEIEAHKALDRGYGVAPTRLVKQSNRVVRTIEDVPPMWETGT